MGSIPSVAALQRRLNDAKAREAALKIRQTTAQPKVGQGQPNPTDPVKYSAIFVEGNYIVNASRAAVAFFGGGAALGLAAPDASPRISRGFAPAKIRATRGRASGVKKTADLSKRDYLKYSIDATGDTRATFTAPISADTVATLRTRFQTVSNSKKDDIGEYGRIAFIPEKPVFSTSGVVAAPAP